MTAGNDQRGGRRKLPRRFLALAATTVIAVVIQFIPITRTNPPVVNDAVTPPAVRAILRRACYDCHSYETRWPWYSRVAPMSWLVANHVVEGRGHLNFSRWPSLDFDLEDQFLRGIAREVGQESMPPSSYMLIHRDAALSPWDRKTLLEWAKVP